MFVSSTGDTFYKLAPEGRFKPADGCGQNLRALRKLLSLGKEIPMAVWWKWSVWNCPWSPRQGGGGQRRAAGEEGWRESGKGQGGENPKLQTTAEVGMCFEKSVWIFNVDPNPNQEKKVDSVFALFTGFELLYCLDITHNLEVKDLLTLGLCWPPPPSQTRFTQRECWKVRGKEGTLFVCLSARGNAG